MCMKTKGGENNAETFICSGHTGSDGRRNGKGRKNLRNGRRYCTPGRRFRPVQRAGTAVPEPCAGYAHFGNIYHRRRRRRGFGWCASRCGHALCGLYGRLHGRNIQPDGKNALYVRRAGQYAADIACTGRLGKRRRGTAFTGCGIMVRTYPRRTGCCPFQSL